MAAVLVLSALLKMASASFVSIPALGAISFIKRVLPIAAILCAECIFCFRRALVLP